MELQSLSRPSAASSSVTRRAWLVAPVGLASLGVWWLSRKRSLPNASETGAGTLVPIVLFSDGGRRLGIVRVGKIIRSLEEWRKDLDPEAFAVTRQQATEFAFHNVYWDKHETGIYRCVCCGNALFKSLDKYDSDTGWPSFIAPIADENVSTQSDRSLGFERTQVECRKCDAHLGHLFNDGPEPSRHRYCLNSAALRFVAFS